MVAIQQDTTVQPGGFIHIHSSQLPPGTRVHVTITLDQPAASVHRTLSSFHGAAKGGFQSTEEVDAFLRAERDSWQR